MYLLVLKLRNGGYVPFFLAARKRSEAALIQVVREVYIHGVSTRKMEKLAQSLGIDHMSGSCVSELTHGLNEQAEEFRSRPLSGHKYPVIWTDALYEKVRSGNKVVSMTVLVICGVNEEGRKEVLAIELIA